ncbi:MAG: NTP transferase domain-containing protein [Woeseiaceae bacterium]|nr:NTP transferase domain-containing protein [Woeseiaceae bacterium]
MSERPLFGLVLAGGKSRRMGVDKALLVHDGESQLARTVKMVDGVADRTFVSTRAAQSDEPERARFEQIIDQYDDMGPVAGVLSAMNEHPDVDWLVVACDLPNISRRTLAGLLAERNSGKPFVAYRSVHNDLPEPLCAIYGEGSDAIVRDFAERGIRCPRKIMINSDTCLIDQPERDALDNINTPDDLKRSILEESA